MKSLTCTLLVLICNAMADLRTTAQTNLLLNPGAESGTESWRANGEATVDEFNGAKAFVVRNGRSGGGSFIQDIALSESDIGKYALLIGRGSSERINADGAITGLPHLYGRMLRSKSTNGARINEYLQGQMMRANTQTPNEWVTMHGIFQVPENTVAIRLFLSQSERRGIPQNGSAARFDDLGLYLFDTEEAAKQFVKSTANQPIQN